MLKRIFSVFLIITALFPACIALSAENGQYIYDEKDYITDNGISELNGIADDIYNKYGISPYVAITDCANDSIIDYVCGLRSDTENRIVLGMNDDYWYIYAGGTAEKIFPEHIYEEMWDNFNEGETWYEAVENFLYDTDARIEFYEHLKSSGAGETEQPEDNDETQQDSEQVEIIQCDKRLYDGADLLTDDEEASLLEKLDALSDECSADILVATVNSIGYNSPKYYADNYYDNNGFSPDGVAFLVSMEDRDWYISTCGSVRNAINDDYGIDCISDRFLSDLSDGNYYAAFNTYADLCADFINHMNTTGKPYSRFTMPKGPMGVIWYIAAIGIGILIGFIIVSVMRSKLISVAEKSQANDFIISNSLKIKNGRETYLYSTVTRTEKPEKSSSSSSSGGGGSSHGGGGGKF